MTVLYSTAAHPSAANGSVDVIEPLVIPGTSESLLK